MRRGICFAIYLAWLSVLSACAPAQPQADAPAAPATGAKPAQPLATAVSPLAPKPTAPIVPRDIPTTTAPVSLANITVSAPASGAGITSPVGVTGTARVFEATVELAVKDASGKVVGQGTATASAGAPEWGKFEAQVAFDAPRSEQQGTVEAFSRSARDGSVQDLFSVKVTLLPK